MPNSKEQFPDPWDPNASDAANSPSDSADASDSSGLEADKSNEDFGLGELQDLLSRGDDSPPRSDVSEDVEGLFPSVNSPDSSFDDLFASLGLDSAAGQTVDETSVSDLSDLISSLEVSAGDPNLELLSAEPSTFDISSPIPDSEGFLAQDPGSLDDEIPFASEGEQQNLDLTVNELEVDAPLGSEALGIPRFEDETSERLLSQMPSWSSELDLPDSDGVTESESVTSELSELSGLEAPELPDATLSPTAEGLETPSDLDIRLEESGAFASPPAESLDADAETVTPFAASPLSADLPDGAIADLGASAFDLPDSDGVTEPESVTSELSELPGLEAPELPDATLSPTAEGLETPSDLDIRLEESSAFASPPAESLDADAETVMPFAASPPSADLPDGAIADTGREIPAELGASGVSGSGGSDSSEDVADLPPLETEPAADVAIPAIPVPGAIPVADSLNIPVEPRASSSPETVSPETQQAGSSQNETVAEDPQQSLVGAGSSSGSASASASNFGVGNASGNVGAASTGATATYKQLLGGRQQIAAFALILAGMGGVAGYGLSKAGFDNPLGTDFSQPRNGILAGQNDESVLDQPSVADSLGTGGTDDGPVDDPENSAASTGDTPAVSDDAQSLGGTTNPAIGGTSSSITTANQPASTTPSTQMPEDPQDLAAKSKDSDNAAQQVDVPPPIDISDVPPEHWAHPYVVAMYEQGIVPDFPDGKFQPDRPVTRAELAASLQRAFKDNAGNEAIPFSDISEGYWAKDAITHAVNTGFMSGYSDDIFEPEQRIPRYQVLVSLVSGLGLPKVEDPAAAESILQDFPDVATMPKWALGQVAAAQQANLIVGDPEKVGNLAPNRPATRAETNAMIYQALVNAGRIKDTVK